MVVHAVALEAAQQVEETLVSKPVGTKSLQRGKNTDIVAQALLDRNSCRLTAVIYLLWSRSARLAGVQGVTGVLQNLTVVINLVLLPAQTAHKEELGGALHQRWFGLFGQDVTAPLLTLQ